MTAADKNNPKSRLSNYLESTQQISPAGLEVISNHKYKSGVYTPLDLLFYEFWWTPVSNLVPVWLAPNMITFIGFLTSLSNIPLMIYHSPTFQDQLPSWVFAYAGFTTFMYLTLDAIDGMQARKTKSSSPLGQLFDHGCDCCITTVFSLMMVHSLRLGPSFITISLIASVQVAFFLSQWEEKYTGTCRTSVGGLFGVTESQMMIVGQMLLSAWDPLVGDRILYKDYSISQCFVGVYLSFLLSISVACILGIVKDHPKSIRELISVVGLNAVVVLWMKSGRVQANEFAVVALCLAFCNSFSTIRVIISSISHMPFPLYHSFVLPFVAIVGVSYYLGGGSWQLLALTGYLGALLDHIVRSLIQVTNEISAYLGIFVFNITKKRVA